MKISVILAFLLSWSFVSSNHPQNEQSDDKSVGKLNNTNDGGSGSSNLAETKSSTNASSGIDWGGNSLSNFSKKGHDDTDKNDHADNKLFLFTLISEILKMGKNLICGTFEGVKKLIETLISKNKSSDIPISGNDLSDNNDNEKTEKHGTRAKRELKASTSGLLWGDPHKGVSEHILKLSEGSTSNVLKSKKATVAEALNGRAIRRILAKAKARAAEAAQHKNFYDNGDFNKWFWSPFDTNIFYRPFFDERTGRQYHKIENNDDSRHVFPVSHRGFDESMNHNHHQHHRRIKHRYNTLPDSTVYADTEYPYTKLWHNSKYQKHLSPKLQITSREKHDRMSNEIFRKPAHHAHRLPYYEDAENTGRASLHARAPHFRVTQDEMTGNGIPNWQHEKWTHMGSRAHTSHSKKSHEFETSNEREEYNKEFTSNRIFDGFERAETDDERVHTGYGINHKISTKIHGKMEHDDADNKETVTTFNSGETKLDDKRYHYDIDNQEDSVYDKNNAITLNNEQNQNLADSSVEHTSSDDPRQKENMEKNNEHYNLNGVQRSTISSTISAETGVEGVEGVKGKQSDNVLVTNISTDTSKQKAANIDIEHYHSEDQNGAANAATSSLSSLSDENGNKHTNNVLVLPSVDDGSVVERNAADDRSVLERTHTEIDNDATSTEIEMGFSEIKSHPPVDLPSVHSSLPHEHLNTHLENQKVRYSVNEYQHSIANMHNGASSKIKNSMDSRKDEQLKDMKTEETSLADSENYNLKENEEVVANAASSSETATSFSNEHRYHLLRNSPSDNSREGNYIRTRKKYMNTRGHRRIPARHRYEIIDIDDRNGEAYVPTIPEFLIPKFKKGHASHDINFGRFDNQEMRDNKIIRFGNSHKNPKENEIDYDGLEKEDGKEFVTNDEIPKESITIFNKRRYHDQNDQHIKRGKYDQRNHHNVHNQHNQYDHHAFNQREYNIQSTSTASNAAEREAWNKYLYFIRQREDEESNALASTYARKKSKKQNNAMGEEISLDRHRKKHVTDEDNYEHLKKHKEQSIHRIKNIYDSAQNIHSIENNKITSSKRKEGEDEEKEMKNENDINNQSENRKTTRTENMIYDDSIDTKSRASSSRKVSNNNNYNEQRSWKSLSSENAHADVQINDEYVYDAHKSNENVDINKKQFTKTEMESIDSKSNHQSAKSSTISQSQMNNEYHVNESNNFNKMIAGAQISDEKISSNDVKNRYQDDNLHKTSILSDDKSQMETMHHSWEKSENNHEIDTKAESLTKTEAISSINAINKSRSNVQNTIASSELSEELQTGFEHHKTNLRGNKKYSTNSNATSSVNNKQNYVKESKLEDPTSFSSLKSSLKTKANIENSSNDLKNIQMNTVNLETSSSSKSSTENEINTEHKLKNFKNIQLNSADSEASSTAILADNSIVENEQSTSSSNLSEESQMKIDLINRTENRINAISKASAETMSSNIIKDEHRYSSSQAKSQYDSSNLQNSQTNVNTAESSIKSTESEYRSDSSKSSASSKSLEKTHVKNKHNSNDWFETQRNNIEHRSELKNEFSSESHIKSRIKSVDNLNAMKDSERNIGNAEMSSKITSSVHMKNGYQSESQDESSFSKSAESQAKNEHYSDNVRINHKQVVADNTAVSTITTDINDDNHRYEDKKIKANWFIDPVNKSNVKIIADNNNNIGKDEVLIKDSEDALSRATSVKTVTSSNIKSMQNLITKLSTDARIHNKKDEDIITDNSAISEISASSRTSNEIEDNHRNELLKTSSLSDLFGKKKGDIIKNRQESTAAVKSSSESMVSSNNKWSQNDLVKDKLSETFKKKIFEEKQNDHNISKQKSENAISNYVYQDNILKDESSAVSRDKTQIKDKTEATAGNSVESSDSTILQNIKHKRKDNYLKLGSSYDEEHTENKINSKFQDMTNSDSVNEMIGMKSTTFNNFNNENRHNLLKVTSSNNLHKKMMQKDKHKSDILFDETADTRITSYDDKYKRGSTLRKVMFLDGLHETGTKHEGNDNISKELIAIDNKDSKEHNLQEMKKHIKDATDVFISKGTIDNTHNLKNDYQDDPFAKSDVNTHEKGQHEMISSINTKAQTESWDKKETAIETDVSTKSTANSINKYVDENDAEQEKSLNAHSNIVQVGKEDNYSNQGAAVENTIKPKISNSNISPIKSQNNVKNKISIETQLKQHDLNIKNGNKANKNTLSTESINSSKIRNAHLDSLETVTSFNSHTKMQQKNMNSVLKESLEEIVANEATSAHTTSSEKAENEYQEKLMKDSSKSNSHTKLQMKNKYDLNVSQEEQITANIKTDSADYNKLEIMGHNDSIKKNSLSNFHHDTYNGKENRNMMKSNLANTIDVTSSAKETNIKNEHENGIATIASLFDSSEKAQTKHEHNSDIQQKSVDMSSNIKDHMIENKNIVNNYEESTKIANVVTSAEATSSNNIKDIDKHNPLKILPSISSHTESQMGNTHSLNVARSNQEITNIEALETALTSASTDNQVKRRNNSVRKMWHVDPHDSRIIKTEHINKKNDKDIVTSRHATNLNNVEIGHQDNLMKLITSINSLSNTQTNGEHESDIFKKKQLISTNSMASADSKAFDYADSKHKNGLKKLGTISSNSYAKSSAENGNHVDVLKQDHADVLSASTSAQTISNMFRGIEEDKWHQMTLSSDSYADARVKDKNIKNIRRIPNVIINEKKEAISSTDTEDPHSLLDLLATTKIKSKGKKMSREDTFKKSLIEPSDLFSSAQIENVHDSEILKDSYEKSAIADTTTNTKSSNQRDRQKDLRKTVFSSSNTQGSQRDLIESTSSANSYAAEQATSENIAKGEKAKEDREVIVNVSTLGKAKAYNEVKGAHPSDWLVTTSGAGTLAEERAQNKDKFNVLREVEEVAVYAGTSTGAATSNNIEDALHDIRIEDSNKYQDASNVEKETQNVAVISDASTASKEIKNKEQGSKNKNKEMTAYSLSDKAHVQMIENDENDSVLHNSKSRFNIQDTRGSAKSILSSMSTSDDTNMNLSTKYDQTNHRISTTSDITPISKETHHSSVKKTSFMHPSIHPWYRISKCDDNIETRKFISEATSLYKMLDKQPGSEILLMKKNPTGPVQIASLKSSVPPLIAYRLVPREVYDRIRHIIANKKIFCTDCPLSN